jgi:hypothetical protein
LGRCFVIYAFILILATLSQFMGQNLIIIGIACLAFIYILVQIGRFNRFMNITADDTAIVIENSLDKKYYLQLAGYLLVSFLAIFLAMYFTNVKSVKSAVYNKNNAPGYATNIDSIRTKMSDVGFSDDVLADLPDMEIIKYDKILSCHVTSSQKNHDGGELQQIICISYFDGGKIRFLAYYKWLKNPVNRISDTISLDYNNKIISPYYDRVTRDFNGAALYDMQTNNGLMTYNADWEKTIADEFVFPIAKLKLFGGNAVNQRGFIAANGRVSSFTKALAFNTIFNFYHQVSIINFPYVDVMDSFTNEKSDISFPLKNDNPVFQKYDTGSNEDYKPVK